MDRQYIVTNKCFQNRPMRLYFPDPTDSNDDVPKHGSLFNANRKGVTVFPSYESAKRAIGRTAQWGEKRGLSNGDWCDRKNMNIVLLDTTTSN